MSGDSPLERTIGVVRSDREVAPAEAEPRPRATSTAGGLDRLMRRPGLRTGRGASVSTTYRNVTEVSLDREARRLEVVVEGERVVVDGVDRLYVRSIPWGESDGTVRLAHGRVSVNGNVAAAVD